MPKKELARLLAELAATHPEVEERLTRHAIADDPARLAAAFRQRLRTWTRSDRFLPRGAATAFGRALDMWLDEIERELLPLDPARAHALADSFLRSDERFFEQADDSDGVIGDAVRAGCRLWLKAAKAQANPSPADWVERVRALVKADEYGAREALLQHADLLFDSSGLRALAARFEEDLERALRTQRGSERLQHGVFKAGAAIGLLADTLQDPDLSTSATLRYSPDPNPLQKEHFAERYIRFGRPADALKWLDGDWGYREEQRERLLADVYLALGDTNRLRSARQALFERSGIQSDFNAWCASLEPSDRAGAAQLARERAKTLADPITGAELMLALGDEAQAEALLIDRHASLRGEDYDRLLSLAQALETKRRLLGTVACFRALLVAILKRARTSAYGYAAEYLHTLRRLNSQVIDYGTLPTHEAFESSMRSTHGRKTSFWNRIST
jgi:hypothetical protein